MITFKQFVEEKAAQLHELLNSKYEWPGLRHESDSLYTTEFLDSEERVVVVNFSKWNGVWSVEFYRDGSFEMTGAGDAIKVFSTVLDIIKEFTESVDPDFITFYAKSYEESRVKFYRRCAKKISSFGYKDISDLSKKEVKEKYGAKVKLVIQSSGHQHFLLVRNDLAS